MFVEKENYFYIEEFEKLGVKAIYTKKNAGNMSDYCPIENQIEGIQKENRKKLLEQFGFENKKSVMAFQTHSANVFVIDENTKKYRKILLNVKENPEREKYRYLKILIGKNKVTGKEMVHFLKFLGGEEDERESS